MSLGVLLNQFSQDALNILGQDEGLSRRQDVASSVLTSFCAPFSHILFGLVPAFPSSFPSCARKILAHSLPAHTEEDQQLPLDETHLSSALEYLCLSLAR